MKTFQIKVGNGRNALAIDAARLIEGRCLIQGASNSGKSYLVRVIAEQTIPAGLQTIILDPEGEFLSLRERCDVLISGKEGDVPTETRSAKLLARRIAETGVSAVVDMSDIRLDDRRELVAIFLDTLDGLPKKLERPRLIVLDEAHKFCPESGKGKATSTDAVITLMSQGRKRGLAGVLVTQRLSKLKKDAAAEAANVFIGKTSPIDLHSAQDMLGVLKEDREALRGLSPGEFYATGPALSDNDVRRFQVRQAVTTHPEPGSRYKMSTPPPRRAIEKILKEFSELPPDQETEAAENLADAKKRIRDLERQLVKATKETAHARGQWSDADIERMVQKTVAKLEKGVKDDYRRADKIAVQVLKAITDASNLLGSAQERMVDLTGVLSATLQLNLVDSLQDARQSAKRHVNGRDRTVTSRPARRQSADGSLPFSWSSAPGKLFAVLIQYHPEMLEQRRIAALAGVNWRSSTFRNALTKLRSTPWLRESGKMLGVTDDASNRFGDHVEPLPTGSELLDGWRNRLGGVPLAIFDALLDAGGQGAREEICGHAGTDPNLSTARNAFTKLRNLGLLEPGRGDLRLNEHVLEALQHSD